MAPPTTLKIAVIPGDGIGKEVMPYGLRCLEAAAQVFDISLVFEHFSFASCDYYKQHGSMMPDDWNATLSKFDAIYFGAVGMPDEVPDHVSLWGSLLKFRREFDQYINLRPARLMPGVKCPLRDRAPGDIDMWIVRENTEGEYSSIGGMMFEGTDREFVVQETVMTRQGMMLSHFGYTEAAAGMLKAIEVVLSRSERDVVTADMGGEGTTETFGRAIEKEILNMK
ncbi:hypothetical protein LTR40_000642 [Exophiala xenobiotica]|nr:hypothetical protein LTR40_000642 [Exophiala xenobiotica]